MLEFDVIGKCLHPIMKKKANGRNVSIIALLPLAYGGGCRCVSPSRHRGRR